MEDSMELREPERQFAVLIDSENISSKYAQLIFTELDKYGYASCRRIYGNWAKDNAWKKEVLLEYSIMPIQQFDYTIRKNSTDMTLVIDAMDLLYRSHVNAFCLVTSDSDFTRLAMKLREEQKFVLGMGMSTTPMALKKSCNRFISLNLIEGDKGRDEVQVESQSEVKEEIRNMTSIGEIREAVLSILDEANGPVGMGEIGSRLNTRFADFDVRNYGYNKFNVFINQEIKNIRIENRNNRMMVYKTQMLSKDEIEGAIKKILKAHSGRVNNLSVIKQELENMYEQFNIADYGYSRFSSFIRSFSGFRLNNNQLSESGQSHERNDGTGKTL